ncbi:hypothetical protein ACEWY4_025234 [Coilia grayii]|uniref:B30.2/SPRY domain-containing protein n=1 Tax=Coilia grayii TaxID=363190 RepID=A0ABD1IWZ5_9TELE
MSEGTYEVADALYVNRPARNTAEKIYMNEVPGRSQRRAGHSNSQDNSGGHHCCYKLAVVLVCVLLLAVTIALRITTLKIKDLQLRYKNLLEEKDELQVHCNSMTAEKAQLSAMTGERDELQRRLCVLESHDMKTIKQHAVDVTLDRDTANPKLILSADGKQVKDGDTRQNVPDTPKRFNQTVNVLGKEGFSSGKFYYEVQVKGKIRWSLGVAKESINREGQIKVRPKYGYWVIRLRNGTYAALAGPSVPLSLKGKPQRVGVFVDYDAGLVSFYDADCWHHIYSFTRVSFTEKIYPFFSPSVNGGGRNSAPLIISPVYICPIK